MLLQFVGLGSSGSECGILASMPGSRVSADERSRAGLCADCIHARKIKSDRGSRFYLCDLSRSDPTFPKYPRLPVAECRGYAPRAKSAP
ncbi:MAG TPA: hypothetical protein VJN21_03475 [Candidatus Acidoferrales bacterium]|nr:hypothetical protein [Candidatus Acidoferrales bacterium]